MTQPVNTPDNENTRQESGTNHLGQIWTQTTQNLQKVPQVFSQWFSIDESQVAEILTEVRAQLPTTEVLLIGKPQAGKSSIVRGLTGVSAEIVGQGFRPHTKHTQRSA